MGCAADHKTISDVVKTHAPGLPIKNVIRARNHYRLDVVDYFAD